MPILVRQTIRPPDLQPRWIHTWPERNKESQREVVDGGGFRGLSHALPPRMHRAHSAVRWYLMGTCGFDR